MTPGPTNVDAGQGRARGTQKRNCPHTAKPNHGRGLCRACYLRMRKDGTLADVESNGKGRPKGFKPAGDDEESPMITELDVLVSAVLILLQIVQILMGRKTP